VVVSILIYFGLAQRLLDRMRLSDKAALAVIAALIIGSFIDIPIMRGKTTVSINAGGALVPIGLAVYLLRSAGTTKEWVRALAATIATTAVIFFIGGLVSGDPGGRNIFIDPLYLYPLVGGATAYLVGRSRRSAFVAATLGVLGLDIVHWVWLGMTGTPGNVNIGGAGAFDSVVVAGLVAVLLAELIGETRERLQGGPVEKGRDPRLVGNLKSIDSKGEEVMKTQDETGKSITDNRLEGEDK
jgi:uncharacterized membrane protein